MAMEHHEAALRALMRLATLAERKHELTVDEVEYNRQQQADEVLVLQSMFPSDFVAINEAECELSAYMINVHVDVPLNFRIVAEVPDSSELQQEESRGTSTSGRTQSINHQHSFTIHHLPSISLLCMLPVTYPSQSPPFFTLSCLWLNSTKLSSLCHGLDKLWNEQSSGVVLHLWAEWLQQALSHVSATEKLELGPYNNGKENGESCNQECDARAISVSTSLDADILELLQYNKEMQNKEFCESFHLCYICFSKQLGNIQLKSVFHVDLGEDLKDTCEAFTKAFSCLRVAVLICGPNWPVTDRNDLTGMTFLQGRTL
jgi:E3 ubiquitin-protein ligase RNF14